MKSYKALQLEIANLQKQALAVRRNELKSVIAEVKKLINEYGLSAEELGFSAAAATAKAGAAAAGRAGVPKATKVAKTGRSVKVFTPGLPKYRDPVTQKTWTGHGKAPGWIVAAKNREALLIDAPAAVAAPKASATAAARPGKANAKASAKSAAVAVKPVKAAKSAKPAKAAKSAKSAGSSADADSGKAVAA